MKTFISVSDLLKEDNEQLMHLGEMLLLLTAISSKKNTYLDILNESDAVYVQDYLTFLEKYLHIEAKEDTINRSSSRGTFMRTKTIIKGNIEDYKKIYQRKMEALEYENGELSKKNEEVNNQLVDLELKYKDAFREIEILRINLKNNIQAERASYDDAVVISNLKAEILKRDFEIQDIKINNELGLKSANDEISRLRIKVETLEDKLDVFKSTHYENEKLKLKIKELNIIKEKLNDYEVMESNLESKNRQIEKLIKEKQHFIAQTEKLMKENMTEREKHRQVDYEKKKLENEFKEIKNNPDVREFIRKSTMVQFGRGTSTLSENPHANTLSNILEGMVQKKESDKSLGDETNKNTNQTDNFQIIGELNETVQQMKEELDEANKLYAQQLEINQSLTKERDGLLTQNQTLQIEIENLNIQKDRVAIEKERIELDKTREELEKNKYLLTIAQIETEKKKLIEEKAELTEKLDSTGKGRAKFDKEVNNLKLQLKENKIKIDKLLTEKQTLTSEFKELQVMNDKLKKNVDNGYMSPGNRKVGVTNQRNSTRNLTKSSPRTSFVEKDNAEVDRLKVFILMTI
jgi:hypothetical protein